MKTLILSIFVALGFLCVLTIETAEGHGEWWGPSEVLSVETRGCCPESCGSSTSVKKNKRYRWRYWAQYNDGGEWVYHWHYGFLIHCVGYGAVGWDDSCFRSGRVCRDEWQGWCAEDNQGCRDDYPSGEYEEICEVGICNYYKEVCGDELLPNKC